MARPDLVVYKVLELSDRPRHERQIDVAQHGVPASTLRGHPHG
jgi:hypothetical protein